MNVETPPIFHRNQVTTLFVYIYSIDICIPVSPVFNAKKKNGSQWQRTRQGKNWHWLILCIGYTYGLSSSQGEHENHMCEQDLSTKWQLGRYDQTTKFSWGVELKKRHAIGCPIDLFAATTKPGRKVAFYYRNATYEKLPFVPACV